MSGASDTWAQARKVAEAAGAIGPEPWQLDLPYLFRAKWTRGVLVHHGAVVTARGPAVAAAYLRDIGILDGKSPGPDSLLALLFVLQAFPAVEGLPEQSAIDTLGPQPYWPRVEHASGHARVVLFYRLPGVTPRGAIAGPRMMSMMREVLEIAPTGDARWVGQPFEAPAPQP